MMYADKNVGIWGTPRQDTVMIDLETGEIVAEGDNVKKINGLWKGIDWKEIIPGRLERKLRKIKTVWDMWQEAQQPIVGQSEILQSTGFTGYSAQFVHWAWQTIGDYPFSTMEEDFPF